MCVSIICRKIQEKQKESKVLSFPEAEIQYFKAAKLYFHHIILRIFFHNFASFIWCIFTLLRSMLSALTTGIRYGQNMRNGRINNSNDNE